MMKPSDRIIGPTRGSAAQAIAIAQDNGALRFGEVVAYINEVYRLAPLVGIDPSIVVAHSCNETDFWRSTWWRDRLNPAGIGITGDPDQNSASKTWDNGADAARAQVIHTYYYCYAIGIRPFQDHKPGPPTRTSYERAIQEYRDLDPRASALFEADLQGTVVTIADLAGKWMADSNGPQAIVSKAAILFPDVADQKPGETPPMASYTTSIPGLPGGPLITTYPIRLNLIALDGYQRPGEKAHTPRRSVQHGTANASNASAWSEAQYFVNGAEGRQASVHSCSDDTEVVIAVPLDEVTWQAADGGGPGNMNGLSNEMMEATVIWNDPVRRNRLIAITADFMGRCSARFNIATPEQHFTFNAGSADRHDCPNKLRHTFIDGRLAWDIYVQQWQTAKADELARMNGEKPAPSRYATPDVPDFIADDAKIGYPRNHEWKNSKAYACLREWTVKKTTLRRLTSTTKSKEVGEPLKAGTKFAGWYIFKSGTKWWILTKSGTRIDMADMTDKVTVSERAA